MKKVIILLLIYLLPFSFSHALIKVDITRGNLDPLPIAVSPLHVEKTSENLRFDLENRCLQNRKM